MNIYFCSRNLFGIPLKAVASASDSNAAVDLLGWEHPDYESDIRVVKIGVSDSDEPCIHVEEYL